MRDAAQFRFSHHRPTKSGAKSSSCKLVEMRKFSFSPRGNERLVHRSTMLYEAPGIHKLRGHPWLNQIVAQFRAPRLEKLQHYRVSASHTRFSRALNWGSTFNRCTILNDSTSSKKEIIINNWKKHSASDLEIFFKLTCCVFYQLKIYYYIIFKRRNYK